MDRDYSSISPSAKALLLTKGLTPIPFAREAASLLFGDDSIEQARKRIADETFLLRLIHFENRYWSVDTLLDEFGGKNILEISSGFSFRGLNRAIGNAEVFYVDTDLPEIMDIKRRLTTELLERGQFALNGTLRMETLNVLNEGAFNQIIATFPDGPLTIVNEGLLVYLDEGEKRRLCSIIHKILTERGGHWITGDIYIKTERRVGDSNDEFSQFLKKHHVDDNKFESFEQAEEFFNSCGFEVSKKLTVVPEKLSAAKYLSPETIARLQKPGARVRVHETWAVKPLK